jgi:tRNA U34 2-thiouridine synthase MnmA/TrmU
VRYHAGLAAARVTRSDAAGFELTFEAPVRAVAPGQAAVLYALDGREVLGGGTIEESRR